MTDPDQIKKAILEENLSGWLFFNFRHIDPLSDKILNIEDSFFNTRGWFYIILSDSENIKITHSVEKSALDHLPGRTFTYTSRNELKKILMKFKGKRFAVQSDINLSQISFLDSGTARFINSCGIKTTSAASLIQKTAGIINKEQIESHENTASVLYRIINDAWLFLKQRQHEKIPVTEKETQDFILREFGKNNLQTEHPPLAAFGRNTADPHYSAEKSVQVLKAGDVVQFDIWAKSSEKNAVYADISWAGYCGDNIPDNIIKAFNAVIKARDLAVSYISKSLQTGKPARGSKADMRVRNYLIKQGYGDYIKHRTGHGIDTQLHGYGVNLDSVEFPDQRKFLDGSCFSIEPGLYFNDFGLRTEINCYISDNNLHISGGPVQQKLLLF